MGFFMKNKRNAISPFLFYILVSTLASLAFILLGALAFTLLSIKFTDIGFIIIAILLLWKGGIVGFVAWFFLKKSSDIEYAVKFIGRYLGCFYGLLIGSVLGLKVGAFFRQGNVIGIFSGAIILYFVGRWIGGRLSLVLGNQIAKVFIIEEPQQLKPTMKHKGLYKFLVLFYIFIVPLLYIVTGLMINWLEIPIGYLTELLPISRIIAIVLSIVVISYTWFMRKRERINLMIDTTKQDRTFFWLGLIISSVPGVYGFILFIAMGASILELCCFALASSIASIVWVIKNPIPNLQEENSNNS